MNTKLSLAIEQAIIEKAKKYASKKGRSLSDIVENYFKVITKEESKSDIGIAPLTKSLRGSFKAPKDFDYKKGFIQRIIGKISQIWVKFLLTLILFWISFSTVNHTLTMHHKFSHYVNLRK